jgi:hypothetical protein
LNLLNDSGNNLIFIHLRPQQNLGQAQLFFSAALILCQRILEAGFTFAEYALVLLVPIRVPFTRPNYFLKFPFNIHFRIIFV